MPSIRLRMRTLQGQRGGSLSMRDRGELISLAILSPLFFCDLGAPLAEHAFCTDATLHRGSMVENDATPEEAVFVWSRLPRRGISAGLDLSAAQPQYLRSSGAALRRSSQTRIVT